MRGLKLLLGFTTLFALAGAVAGQAPRPERPRVTRPDAPDAEPPGSVRGRVLTPEGAPFSGTARLTLQAMNGGQLVIFTDYQGQFNFGAVESGNYTLEVDADRQLFTPVSQGVQVFKGVPSVVNVSLKYKESARGPAPSEAVVSAAELDKNIPEKARKEFKRGSEAAQAGKTDEAIAHFRKAIEIYPNFMAARNDLGAQLLAAARLDEAAEQLQFAARLDPKAFNPQLNLGIVLFKQQQFAEAVGALEKAISANSQSPAARLYAGQAYEALGDLDRAEKELNAAYSLGGTDYAIALFHLGNLYLNRGEREKALASFESYLKAAPGAANAADVRKMIGVLR